MGFAGQQVTAAPVEKEGPESRVDVHSGSCARRCVCVCATPVPKDVGLTISAVMSAGGQWTFWKALPNEDLSSLS